MISPGFWTSLPSARLRCKCGLSSTRCSKTVFQAGCAL